MIQKFSYKTTKKNFSIAMVWIKGGSNMDPLGKKGINQVLCSMLGRGCEGFDNFELSEFIHSHGAEFNQEILEDGILISIKSLDEHFEKLIPLIDLIINKPSLTEEQFFYVKKSTLNSIKKERENPFNVIYEKWRKLVYVNHPYAFNCIGYEEDISQLKYTEILLEYKKFQLRDKYLISNNLKNKPKNNILGKKKLLEKSNYLLSIDNDNSRYADTFQKSNQTIFMMGNQTCSQFSNEYIPLKILESHLSYGMSSVLFKLFRETNGLTYDVGVFNPPKKENSPFLIYLSVSNKNALLAFQLLQKLWNETLSSLLSDTELKLAKEKLRSAYLFSTQSLEDILQRKIQLISHFQSSYSEEEYLRIIDKVTAKEINQVTTKYLSKPFLSVLGEEEICKKIKINWLNKFKN